MGVPLVIRVPTLHIASYPVPISIPTTAQAKVEMEIGPGYEATIHTTGTHTYSKSVSLLSVL